MPVKKKVLFADFHTQVSRLREEIDAAVGRVLDSGWFQPSRCASFTRSTAAWISSSRLLMPGSS